MKYPLRQQPVRLYQLTVNGVRRPEIYIGTFQAQKAFEYWSSVFPSHNWQIVSKGHHAS